MPRPVFDEPILRRLVEQVANRPIHAGPNGELFDPGVRDLLADGRQSVCPWEPADRRTALLVMGTEACLEIDHSAKVLATLKDTGRTAKNLAIPVCNLMDVVVELQRSLTDDESKMSRLTWPRTDQNAFVGSGRRIRKTHSKGPVRQLRNKLAAHLDPSVYEQGWPRLDVEPILEALGDALLVFSLCFNHEFRAFSWYRVAAHSADGTKFLVDTMFDYPGCARWVTAADGSILGLAEVFGGADPRHQLNVRTMGAFNAYNFLVQTTKAALPLLITRDSSKVLEEEGRAPIEQPLPTEFLLARVTKKPKGG